MRQPHTVVNFFPRSLFNWRIKNISMGTKKGINFLNSVKRKKNHRYNILLLLLSRLLSLSIILQKNKALRIDPNVIWISWKTKHTTVPTKYVDIGKKIQHISFPLQDILEYVSKSGLSFHHLSNCSLWPICHSQKMFWF